MSRKPQQKEAGKTDDWKGYVNFSPTAKDKERIVEYMGSKGWDAHLVIEQFTESGYTVSHSYDEGNSCVRCSVTGKGKHCPNKGYTLSVRASSVERCMGIAGFYSFILCESGDWLVDKKGEEVW